MLHLPIVTDLKILTRICGLKRLAAQFTDFGKSIAFPRAVASVQLQLGQRAPEFFNGQSSSWLAWCSRSASSISGQA